MILVTKIYKCTHRKMYKNKTFEIDKHLHKKVDFSDRNPFKKLKGMV